MKLLSLAWGVLWVTHVAAFLTPHPITARRSAVAVSSAAGLVPPSPDELKAKAAAIREEIKELEANASATNRPNADLVKPLPVREQASDGQTLTNILHLSQYSGCDHRSLVSTGCTHVNFWISLLTDAYSWPGSLRLLAHSSQKTFNHCASRARGVECCYADDMEPLQAAECRAALVVSVERQALSYYFLTTSYVQEAWMSNAAQP